MIFSENLTKEKHVEELIEKAEKTGDFGVIEIYEDMDISDYIDEMDDIDETPVAEEICKVVYKKR